MAASNMLRAARTEALFASNLSMHDPRLQPDAPPDVALSVLEEAVRETIGRFGTQGCAVRMAAQCGEDLYVGSGATERLAWAHALAALLGPETHTPVLVPA